MNPSSSVLESRCGAWKGLSEQMGACMFKNKIPTYVPPKPDKELAAVSDVDHEGFFAGKMDVFLFEIDYHFAQGGVKKSSTEHYCAPLTSSI